MLIVHDGAVVLGVSRIGDLAVWEADGVMCSAAMADAVDAATVAGVGHYAH